VKNRDFFIPLAFDAPVRVLRYRLVRKTKMVGLPNDVKFDVMFSRFDRIPAYDGRADRRTDILRRHSPRCA